MTHKHTLTRSEALYLIDDAELRGDSVALNDLCIAWIGHDENGCDSDEDVAEYLREYVDAACLTDDVRSRGPRDDDDTGLTGGAL